MIHEFAALALSLMATEFTSKVAIHEAGSVEPLVRLLTSSDPDVQKNSIEALAQLVMVCGNKFKIKKRERDRKCNVFLGF